MIDWEQPVEWSTGEELIVLDGPSFDGGLEVRSPVEFAKEERQGSCTIWISTGVIAHPRSGNYPVVQNKRP